MYGIPILARVLPKRWPFHRPESSDQLAGPKPRFAITPHQIDYQVHSFYYYHIRFDPVLGPIFDARIDDWSHHVGKIANFWQKTILGEGDYAGNPIRTHAGIPQIKPELFDRWLGLFEQSLRDTVPPEAQKEWMALARRIGQSFSSHIEKRDAGLLRNINRGAENDELHHAPEGENP